MIFLWDCYQMNICDFCRDEITDDVAIVKYDYEYGGYLFTKKVHGVMADDCCLMDFLDENRGKEFSVTYYHNIKDVPHKDLIQN